MRVKYLVEDENKDVEFFPLFLILFHTIFTYRIVTESVSLYGEVKDKSNDYIG